MKRHVPTARAQAQADNARGRLSMDEGYSIAPCADGFGAGGVNQQRNEGVDIAM
jgi:hypothetical protein